MESLHDYVASRFYIVLHLFIFIASVSPSIMATNTNINPNNLSTDVTMESLVAEIRNLKAELTALQTQESFQNLSIDECGRGRLHSSHPQSWPHNTKIQYCRVAKVEAVQQFERPCTVKALQHLLGMVNFYRRFLPGIAAVMQPLTDALAGAPPQLTWTEAMTSAFQLTKRRLAEATMLVHPVDAAELRVNTDASSKAIAGAIHQVVQGQLQPLAFFSRRTLAAEARYSAYDLNLLAVYSTVLKFRHMLEGR